MFYSNVIPTCKECKALGRIGTACWRNPEVTIWTITHLSTFEVAPLWRETTAFCWGLDPSGAYGAWSPVNYSALNSCSFNHHPFRSASALIQKNNFVIFQFSIPACSPAAFVVKPAVSPDMARYEAIWSGWLKFESTPEPTWKLIWRLLRV